MDLRSMQEELFPRDVIETTVDVHEKVSRYFNRRPEVPPIYVPQKFYPGTLGAYDPSNVVLIYNPNILDDPILRRKVARHEAVHSAQPGLENLLCFYAVYVEDEVKYIFPIGRAIAEGSAELLLEKIGRGRTGAYEKEYRLVKKIDEVLPIKYLHELAENNPYELLKVLNQEDVKRVIRDYIFENYVSAMYN